MIYIILGMHKSGTTLISETLHKSGIPMGDGFEGQYPHCKYEDGEISQIIKQYLYGSQNRHSLDLPEIIPDIDNETEDKFLAYIEKNAKKPNWGFKFPDFTLCYDKFKHLLPEHQVIGIYRNIHGVLDHYGKSKKNHSRDLVRKVRAQYNKKLVQYEVPTILFEDFISDGPGELSKIIGKDLIDCRSKKNG